MKCYGDIVCNGTNDNCIIDCAEEYYTFDGCRNKIINATNAAAI